MQPHNMYGLSGLELVSNALIPSEAAWGKRMAQAERLRGALGKLREILDPHGVGEDVTIRLQHDTGMPLVNTLLNDLPTDEMRVDLTRVAAATKDGRETYDMHLDGVRFEWPGRRVDLGSGKFCYV